MNRLTNSEKRRILDLIMCLNERQLVLQSPIPHPDEWMLDYVFDTKLQSQFLDFIIYGN